MISKGLEADYVAVDASYADQDRVAEQGVADGFGFGGGWG